MRTLLALLLLLGAAMPAAAEHATFPPFDEAGQEPSFRAYRAGLLAAVERRDLEAVTAMASADINLSFGGDSGRQTFMAWLADPETGEDYWQTLERVLGEGGKFEGGLFIAPWTYWMEPPPEFDIYGAGVVAGTNVRLRERPTTDGRIVRALTYEIVSIPPYDPEKPDHAVDDSGRAWTRIQTLHGESGWMASDFLRFSLDYRAGFEKGPDGWQMIFFIAGD